MTNNYEEYDIMEIIDEIPTSTPLSLNITNLDEPYSAIVSC